MFFSSSILKGQNGTLDFDNTPIPIVLKTIEQRTNHLFNWDPELLSDHKFSGQFDLDNIDASLSKLLYETPCGFEKTKTTYLIYLEEVRTFRLCGSLLDQQTKLPVMYANILLEGSSKGTATDSLGYFDFRVNARKNDLVKISYVGYSTRHVMVQTFDSRDCGQIYLSLNDSLWSSDILITDYLMTGIDEGHTYSSINIDIGQYSSNYPNVEQDILKSAQLIPGVTSLDESAANIQIRGATPDQNLIMWEGVTLYDPGHLFGMISAINPFVLDEIEIHKSVFNPKYDNRIGGIVDMSLSDSIPDRTRGGVGSTMTEAHAFVELPVINDRLSVLMSGRKTINSLWESPTISNYSVKVFQATKVTEEDAFSSEQTLDFYDWNAKLLFRPVDKLLFKAGIFKSKNNYSFTVPFFDNDFSSSDRVDFGSQAYRLSAEYQFSEKLITEFSYSSSEYTNTYELTVTDNEEDELIEFRDVYNDINDQTWGINNSLTINKNLTVDLGYDYNKKAVNFNVFSESEFEEEYDDENFTSGQFHNLHSSFQLKNETIQLDGGLKVTRYDELEQWIFSPRLNVQYALNDHFKIKSSVGILQQYISQLQEFGDNDLGIDNPVWVLNQAELDSSAYLESNKASLGFVFRKNGWLLDLDVFNIHTNGLNTINPLFGQGVDVPDFEVGSSMARGLDMLIRKRIGSLSTWLNYSFNDIVYSFPDINENDFPATNDIRHNMSLINNFAFSNHWIFSLSYHYRTGLRFSRPDNLLMEDDGEGNSFYEIVYEDLNSERLIDYHRLDLGVTYKRSFSKYLRGEFAFSMINLLDRENQFSRNYVINDFDDDETPEITSFDKYLLGRTPQLLVRFYW